MYSARISSSNPTAFVILIDQSGSMNEQTLYNNELMSKSQAVANTVNMLLSELMNRSKREDGYRDYFDIAVLGYHGDEVNSLLGREHKPFKTPRELDKSDHSVVTMYKERLLPNGDSVVASVDQKVWISPFASDKTPMYAAMNRCFAMVSSWCSNKSHRNSYPPTILNITDAEATDCNNAQLLHIADKITSLSTDNGNVLLINIHITSLTNETPVLFPTTIDELPNLRYARLLFQMSSVMPPLYNENIISMYGKKGDSFRGFSFNAGMTDLVGMMNIGSVSVNLL